MASLAEGAPERPRVVVGVSGGIAAYKACEVVRGLTETGHDVRVVPTPAALHFVGAATWAALSGHPAAAEVWDEVHEVPHVRLGQQADLVLVVPATADLMARAAHGLADDLLTSTLLTARCPVLYAPAMHTEMWENPATQRNMRTLREDGYHFVGPETGDLAGGDIGIGRVAEPEQILEAIEGLFDQSGGGRRFVVTAGGTREPMDPVRFLGNRSSGKMGHAIADEAARRGFHVTLVTTSDLPSLPSVKVVRVETAEEMHSAIVDQDAEIAVLAAAVADFRPARPAAEKVPRASGLPSIPLEPTPDILESVVARRPRPYVVGFAAETGGVERAIEKAEKKNVDLLIYNNVAEPGSSFGSDTNEVVIIDRHGATEPWPLMSKREVATRLIDRILNELGAES